MIFITVFFFLLFTIPLSVHFLNFFVYTSFIFDICLLLASINSSINSAIYVLVGNYRSRASSAFILTIPEERMERDIRDIFSSIWLGVRLHHWQRTPTSFRLTRAGNIIQQPNLYTVTGFIRGGRRGQAKKQTAAKAAPTRERGRDLSRKPCTLFSAAGAL